MLSGRVRRRWMMLAGALACSVTFAVAQDHMLDRGAGFFFCEGANTTGPGNFWGTGRIIGFIWDDPDPNVGIKPFPFLELKGELGLAGFASLIFDSRVSSYFWNKRPQFGNISLGGKFTLPDNKDLRFKGLGLEFKGTYSAMSNFPSLGGYRLAGTGFSPEGFIMGKGSVQWKVLFDNDYIALASWLPLRTSINAGMKIPFDNAFLHFTQYLLSAGAGYVGLNADGFVEFSYEGFVNRSTKPKMFTEYWYADPNGNPVSRTWEVAFTENPMYLAIGGRIKYEDGLIITGCVPLLISSNVGSAMTQEDGNALDDARNNPGAKFYDEAQRGITDPFDPWFARWKVVLEVSVPIMYRQTAAELRRQFLLMKNRKKGKAIDIDERLKALQTGDETQTQPPEKSDQQRLEEIQKRRERAKSGSGDKSQ
jgi:hypothetical protein